jgi:large subunit ribosomal protein L35
MPKLKTKSGAKKRFKLTATGKVKVQQAGKRHGMIKRTAKFVRNARGTTVLSDPDARIIKKNFLPNG